MSETNTKTFLEALSKLSDDDRKKALQDIETDMYSSSHSALKKFLEKFDSDDPSQIILMAVFYGILGSYGEKIRTQLKKNPTIKAIYLLDILITCLDEQEEMLKNSKKHAREFIDKKYSK